MNLYHKTALIITCIQTFTCMGMQNELKKFFGPLPLEINQPSTRLQLTPTAYLQIQKHAFTQLKEKYPQHSIICKHKEAIERVKKQEEQELAQHPTKRYYFYPASVEEQAVIINEHIQSNDIKSTDEYVTGMYDERFPLLTKVNTHAKNNAVTGLCNNTVLTTWADNFQKNPTTASKRDKNTAIFLASLRTYNDNQDLLIKASRYLENAQLKFPMQNACLKHNRGMLYLNLASIQKDSLMMEELYYKKSAENGNVDGIVEFTTSWLKQVPITKNKPGLCGVHGKTVLEWLINVSTKYEDDENINKLIHHDYFHNYMLDIFMPKLHKAIELTCCLINENESECNEINEQQIKDYTHNLYEQNNKALKQSTIEQLRSIANNGSPYEAAILAQYYSPNNMSESKKYLVQTITNGIILSKNKKHLFKNHMINNLISRYLNYLLTNATTTTSCEAITFLKTKLEQHKINTDAFAALFKRNYGHDLTEYTEWADTTGVNKPFTWI